MERRIAHIYIPAFPIQMELLRYPTLKGRPLAVVPNLGERAIIRAASWEAQNAGIRKGMFLSSAMRLCRDLQALPFDARYYLSSSETVYAVARNMSPVTEPDHFGKAYADLSYLKNSKRLIDACWRAIKDIRSIGMAPVVGLAGNKLVSMIASRVSESDLHNIESGKEKPFLRPLQVDQLPVVDARIWRQLALMGLKLIGNVAGFQPSDLSIIFGRSGAILHEQANGIDFSPVIPSRQAQARVFGQILVPDTNDIEVLRGRLNWLAEQACMELRSKGLHAVRLSLEIEHSDTKKSESSIRLPRPSSSDMDIKDAAMTMLKKAIKRRVGVRVILLSIIQAAPAAEQLCLFTPTHEEKRRKVDKAIDSIRGRFGDTAIGYARVA